MSRPQESLQNLNDGSQESLRALIQALVPEASTNQEGKFNGDVVEKLTEKLSQLAGPGAVQEYKEGHNERGELVNEEGLPIIDINEPVDIATKLQSPGSIPPLATVEPLLPLAALPPSARDRLRERRNRILDALEREEEESQQRETDEADEALQRRKEEAAKEKDKRKEARELQKKMGKALLQNLGKDKQKEEEEKERQRRLDDEADKRRSPSTKKKTVAFVESADNGRSEKEEDKAESSSNTDWGDITPGRLRNTKRPTLLTQSLLDKHPMKMSVVERVPGGQPTLPKPTWTPQRAYSTRVADSDDESEPDSDEDNASDEEPVLEEDAADLDYAQHQREIALEYYKKRNTIGQTAATAMMNHSHEADEDKPPNFDLAPDSAKPGISQFKANRFASAYGASIPATSESSTTSLVGSVLPASSTRTIRRAIRTGKLDDDGKLIGGENDSASEEEDQGIQEVLDLLRKGEVYNLGPDGNYIHTVRPNPNTNNAPNALADNEAAVAAAMQPVPAPEAPTQPPPSMRLKTSRFKASRSAAGRPATSSTPTSIPSPAISDSLSPSATPISHVGRSSPKLQSPFPISSVVSERATPSVAKVKSPNPAKPPAQASSPFSMIIDSPSFPMPQGIQYQDTSFGSGTSPMVISSPSFSAPSTSRRPERPPQVLATHVMESKPRTRQPEEANDGSRPEKKVSRFKADRM